MGLGRYHLLCLASQIFFPLPPDPFTQTNAVNLNSCFKHMYVYRFNGFGQSRPYLIRSEKQAQSCLYETLELKDSEKF